MSSLMRVTPERLVERNRLPADRKRSEQPFVVATDALVAAVPPAVTRFDAQPQIGPREVDVDLSPRRQVEGVLADRFGEPDRTERLDQIELEPALCRSLLLVGCLEPSLHPGRSVLPSAAVRAQVLGRRLRRDQAEMPAVLRCSSEASVAQASREVVEHPVWLGDGVHTGDDGPIAIRRIPGGPPHADPRRQVDSMALGNRHADRPMWHLAQAVQSARCRAGEKAAAVEVERDGGAAREKRVG